MPNVMYWGAGAIAERLFGQNTPETRRRVYRMSTEIPADRGPIKFRKIGRTLALYEADIGAEEEAAA